MELIIEVGNKRYLSHKDKQISNWESVWSWITETKQNILYTLLHYKEAPKISDILHKEKMEWTTNIERILLWLDLFNLWWENWSNIWIKLYDKWMYNYDNFNILADIEKELISLNRLVYEVLEEISEEFNKEDPNIKSFNLLGVTLLQLSWKI